MYMIMIGLVCIQVHHLHILFPESYSIHREGEKMSLQDKSGFIENLAFCCMDSASRRFLDQVQSTPHSAESFQNLAVAGSAVMDICWVHRSWGVVSDKGFVM